MEPNAYVQNLMDAFPLRCTAQGCPTNGALLTYGALRNHGCKAKKVDCPFGCGNKETLATKDSHYEVCPYATLTCDLCE